jgi:hypothetical protein
MADVFYDLAVEKLFKELTLCVGVIIFLIILNVIVSNNRSILVVDVVDEKNFQSHFQCFKINFWK